MKKLQKRQDNFISTFFKGRRAAIMRKVFVFCLVTTILLLLSSCNQYTAQTSISSSSSKEQDDPQNSMNMTEPTTFDTTIQEKTDSNISIVDTYQGNVLALSEGGDLWSWGPNYRGLVGNGGEDTYVIMPTKIMENVKTASFNGSSHVKAITKEGELWVWGHNDMGQLCDGTTIDRKTPFKLADHVRETFYNYGGTAYVTESGELWACGYNATGKLGVGHRDPVLTPVKVLENVKFAYLENGLSYAILENGELWTWGNNHGFIHQGILGNGSTEPSYIPQKILDRVESVSNGLDNVFILKNNGELWGYGSNYAYQLLDGTTTPVYSPKKIMDDVKKVFNGLNSETFVLKENGDLYMLDGNEDELPPRKILDNVQEFYLFPEYFNYAITHNGELWVWGTRITPEGYQFINNDENTRYKPVKIFDNVKDICHIHMPTIISEIDKIYILTNDGELWAMGDSRLWDGKETGSQTPVKIMENIEEFFFNSYYGMTYIKDIYGKIWGVGGEFTYYKDSLIPVEIKFID
jgi:alpha-tubulin suppressor-like RCC1 family protein